MNIRLTTEYSKELIAAGGDACSASRWQSLRQCFPNLFHEWNGLDRARRPWASGLYATDLAATLPNDTSSTDTGFTAMRFRLVFGFFITCTCSVAAAPQTGAVTNVQPIPIASGANYIANLAPGGRDGLILLGWRDNGNAHGYDLAVVLVQDRPGAPFNVVDIDFPGETGWTDGVRDDPHMGVDAVRSFRFARGRIDDRPSTLLLLATREPGESIPSPSRVAFEVYTLEHAPGVGTTPDHFKLLTKDRSQEPYCNAETALSKRFRIPLRASYVGPLTPDGCS